MSDCASPPGVPKHVALVSDWCLPRKGGIETHIQALATALRRSGVEATIVTSFPGPEHIDSVPIDRLDVLRVPNLDLAASPRLVGMLQESFSRGGYDMVHIHCSIVAPLCFAALPAAHALGLPVLVTFHSVMRTMPLVLSAVDRATRWTNWNVQLTAVSELIAGQLRDRLRGCPVGVLPNGFESGDWTGGIGRDHDDGRVRLVSTMRLQSRKRPFALIDSFAKARSMAARRGVSLSLDIAGDGPLRTRLERHIGRSGLTPHVNILGWQPRQDLKSLYARSALFVMPSHQEAFCIAALEARAAGLPVLAMRHTGISDFIQDRASGVLVGDDDEMARAIAELAVDVAQRRRLAACEGDLSRYDWQNLVAEHIRLYRACLQAGRPVAR